MLTGLRICVALCLLAGGAAQAQTFVWRVTDADNSVFLAGSVHLLPENAYPLPAAFLRAFGNAGVVAFETDLGQLQQLQPQTTLYEAVPYNDGTRLADHLDDQLYADVKHALEAFDLPVDQYGRYRPWYVAGALELQAPRKAGFKSERGADIYFYDKAKKAGKKILPLASVSDHLALLTEMPESIAQAYLRATIDHLQKGDDEPLVVYDFWHRGDASGLADHLDKQIEKTPGLYQRMLFARNQAWLPKIERLIAGNTDAMVVVGALHLVGERGLIRQLRQRGYRVVRQ